MTEDELMACTLVYGELLNARLEWFQRMETRFFVCGRDAFEMYDFIMEMALDRKHHQIVYFMAKAYKDKVERLKHMLRHANRADVLRQSLILKLPLYVAM